MARKQKYYRLDRIKKTGAPWRLLLGEKANGKSYAVKEEVLSRAWNDPDDKFILLRRYDLELKQTWLTKYFKDPPAQVLERATEGQANCIISWQGNIYFAHYDSETGETKKLRIAGYYISLTSEQHYASGAFPDVQTVVFEEFISRSNYLPDEPKKLQYLVSTIARHRQITVYLVGNTMSRICPYFHEWQLVNIPRQKQGTIEIYHQKSGDDVIDVAVELCEDIGYKNKMFFGVHKDAIVSGSWEVDTFPHLLGHKEHDYESLYTIVIKAKNFMFLAEFLLNKETGIGMWYVSPKTTPIKEGTRLVTDTPDIFDILTTCGFRALAPEEAELFEYFKRPDGVVYSDNLTGTDFTQCLKYLR